ncbi:MULTISPECIES: hypothetical protein [unclassified Treponema]|nr:MULTISPECIES: hypothetical protein [unclassified Treponema]
MSSSFCVATQEMPAVSKELDEETRLYYYARDCLMENNYENCIS